MRRVIVLSLVLVSLAGCGEERDVLGHRLRELESEEFSIRNAAEKGIVEYFDKHVGRRWEIGKRILAAKDGSTTEAQQRVDRILEQIRCVPHLNNVPQDLPRKVPPDIGDTEAKIDSVPIIVIVIDSEEMFRFYRPCGQGGMNQEIPKVDFKARILLSVATSVGFLVKKFECTRDFQERQSSLRLTIIPGDELAEGWGGAVSFDLDKDDLPLTITTTGPTSNSPELRLLIGTSTPTWSDVAIKLKERDIPALRRLAETCMPEVTAEQRREFLQKGYKTDPLLPYVLFTNLAKKHPDLFLQDYEYWKDQAPDSAVVGVLFRTALEHGKKIVER